MLLLLRALNEVRQLAEPFLGQESVPVKNIMLPGLDGSLSLAAALSFVVLGIRLLNQNLHLYRYSLGLLWIVFWSAFRLVVRFGQLPMAFRMPQRLLEVLLMTAQCLFFLEGSHILCLSLIHIYNIPFSNIRRQFAVVFHRHMSFRIAVHADVTDFCGRNHAHHTCLLYTSRCV